jgi:hypothetical protein
MGSASDENWIAESPHWKKGLRDYRPRFALRSHHSGSAVLKHPNRDAPANNFVEAFLHPMKIIPFFAFFLITATAFTQEAMKFVSPDKSSTLVVDKSGKRDLIELKSGKAVHRLFYEDLDSIFKPKIAEAFNASLDKIGKIVLPTFTSARWISADEVEIKGESSVVINDNEGDAFTFTASVSKSGSLRHLSVVPSK